MKERKLELTSATAIIFYLSLFKFFLLILFAGNYGIFRDEYYYIECSKHLDWGFVDQPPLCALILFISRTFLGESILAIRIFAYIASSATVFISGLIARELGGRKFAQSLTALAVIFCPVILFGGSFFSMNAFDVLLSSLFFYYLIRLVKTENPKLWMVIGLICGIGLENKLTFLFLGFGLAVGLILTKNRKYLLSKELLVGGIIVLLISLPNIIWQMKNDFPTLEFMRNASTRKNVSFGFLDFFLGSLMELNPFYIIFLAGAFYFLLFHKEGKRFTIFAWMYISIFVVFVLNSGKPYYMGVLYPMIISAGVVGADLFIEKYMKNWARYTLAAILIPSFIVITPFAIPILNVETYINYSSSLGIKPASGERSRLGILPQFFADRFGWEQMVQETAEVYNKLSQDEKSKVLIAAQNYGEAGAVNYYREKYGLPLAISPHNNYWLWKFPQEYTGEVMIIIGGDLEGNKEFFEEVEVAAHHYNKYGMPYENVDIYICRKPKMKLSEAWQRIKNFI
ncbi:MAG: glycosyltransferase family 39 protein [Melioribacter sp.]|nr:glycosyltransferase family 39 protein [Melioribacter sp.]